MNEKCQDAERDVAVGVIRPALAVNAKTIRTVSTTDLAVGWSTAGGADQDGDNRDRNDDDDDDDDVTDRCERSEADAENGLRGAAASTDGTGGSMATTTATVSESTLSDIG